jgi:hypothetical protein
MTILEGVTAGIGAILIEDPNRAKSAQESLRKILDPIAKKWDIDADMLFRATKIWLNAK